MIVHELELQNVTDSIETFITKSSAQTLGIRLVNDGKQVYELRAMS